MPGKVKESGIPGRLVAHWDQSRPRLRSTLGGVAATSRGCAARAAAEASTCAGVARKRQEEGVRRVGGLELVRVLLLPAAAQKDEVTRTRRELLPPEQLLGAPPDGSSRIGRSQQCSTASANGSGSKIGGTGRGCKPIFWRARSNWGVLIAPGRITEPSTPERSFSSSTRADSKNVRRAALPAQ